MKPRELLLNPELFGKQKDVAWRSDSSIDDLAAAELQHRYCYEMRKEIKRKYSSIKRYCSETSQNYQRVSQVLRGAATINGGDLGSAVAHLDISVDVIRRDGDRTAAKSTFRDAVGAFYTPEDVSAYMVRKLGISQGDCVLEPSFGDGSFLKALRSVLGEGLEITACEIDPAACSLAVSQGILKTQDIFSGSFFDLPGQSNYDAVIGNPPYVRLRALSKSEKGQLISLSESILDSRVGEESSEWLPFLLKSTRHLARNGSLAFVLPFDFTYVKYARDVWRYLGEHFGGIEVLRSKQRIFGDILQDVILLFAYGMGGATEYVEYKCFETRTDLLEERPLVQKRVSIADISSGDRAFQKAMVSADVLDFIESSTLFCRASEEAEFHIGYVCGNKNFFHPSKEAIKKYSIPSDSLHDSIVSSRQTGRYGIKTSGFSCSEQLWLPGNEPSPGERKYIAFGESKRVNEGYKCKARKPWWIVPSVKTPEAIISVFGEAPRAIINDAEWTFSNSLLGAYLKPGISAQDFCLSWYSSLTLLSIELEIHSLGGGVLVAVPRETGKVRKLAARYADSNLLAEVDAALKGQDVNAAYQAGDKALSSLIGEEMVQKLRKEVENLRSWRVR